MERPDDVPLKRNYGPQAVELRPLYGQLRVDRFGHQREAPLFDPVTGFQLRRSVLHKGSLVDGDHVLPDQRVRHHRLALCVRVRRVRSGDRALLGQPFSLELGTEGHELRLCRR